MWNLSRNQQIAALVTAALVVIIAGAVIFLWLWWGPAEESEEPPVGPTASCWGCVPFETLISLFELQMLAAEPRIEQYERQLERTNLTLAARQSAMAALEVSSARFFGAMEARTRLDQAMEHCLDDAGCRLGPQAFQEATCPGPWPDDDTRERFSSLASRIYAIGSTCHDQPCPGLNCSARAQMQSALDEFAGTLGAFGSVRPRITDAPPVDPLLADLRSAMESLPLVLSYDEDDALTTWAEDAAITDFIQDPDDWLRSASPDVSWRLRIARLQLMALTTEIDESSADGPGWGNIGAYAGAVLSQVHYLERYLENEPSEGTCLAPQTDEISEMAGELRRAAAALSVCGARAGCSDTPVPLVLTGLYDRAPYGPDGLERFAAEAGRLIQRNLDTLALENETESEVTTDLDRYRAGEAIFAQLGPEANRCISEPGTWIGIFDPSGTRNPIERRYVHIIDEVVGALVAAPVSPGEYELRAFASTERGGSELARAPVEVGPAAEGCEGFSGKWTTDFGELQLSVRDGVARGTYRRSAGVASGFLRGDVRGSVLRGAWDSELGSGGARLVLADDGRSFTGSWSHIPGRYGGSGNWNGACVPTGSAE